MMDGDLIKILVLESQKPENYPGLAFADHMSRPSPFVLASEKGIPFYAKTSSTPE